eukprot:symbB.v1.2.023451.t1/scaffold2139.1/size165116/5
MQSASNTSASDQISQPSNWISTTSTLPYSESPSSAANTSQRTLPVACILAPVAEKHFSSLTILAALVEKFMVDQPPLYTIFDDELLKQKFCRQRAWLCKKDFFRPLSFRGILGPRTYSAAWELVMKMYLKNLNRTKDDKCPARSEGRVWQTMKKFYGAVSVPCETLFVVDAESLPFRKDNLTRRMMRFVEQPRWYISMWFPDLYGCTFKQDFGLDEAYCNLMSAKYFGAKNSTLFWGMKEASHQERPELLQYFQQLWHFEQFWPYHPPFVKRMLSHWESIWGTSFALGFPRLGVTDAGFYALNWLHGRSAALAAQSQTVSITVRMGRKRLLPMNHAPSSGCSLRTA